MRRGPIIGGAILLLSVIVWAVSCSRAGSTSPDRSDDVRVACQKQAGDERLALPRVGTVIRDSDRGYHAEVTGQVPGGARTYRCEATVAGKQVQARLVLVDSSPIGLPPTPRR